MVSPGKSSLALGAVLPRPLVLGTACFALGIGLDRWSTPPPSLLLLLAALGLGGAALIAGQGRGRLPLLGLLLASAVLLGAGAHAIRHRLPLAADHLLRLPPGPVTLIGDLVEGPWTGAEGRQRFLLEARWARREGQPTWQQVSGGVSLTLAGRPPWTLLAGDRVLVGGEPRAPRGYGNPGCLDLGALLAVRGAAATLFAPQPEAVVLLQRGQGLTSALARLRTTVSTAIDRGVADPQARELVRGLALGDAGGLSLEVRDAMAATGTAHLIALSGGNVALVALVAHLLCSWLLRRRPRLLLILAAERWAACGTIVVVILYTLLVGAQIPTARAAVMTVTFLLAGLVGRTRDLPTVFALAALLLLASTPASLFDPSFQLSFLAVLALLLGVPRLLPPLQAWRPPPDTSWWRPVALRWRGAEAVAVAFAAWLGTGPVVAFHFQQLSLISPLANLLVVPLVSLVLFPLAASLLVLAPLCPPLAGVVAGLAGHAGEATAWLNVQLAQVPGAAVAVPSPSPFLFLLLLVALGGLGVLPRGRRRRLALAGLGAAGLAWGAPFLRDRVRTDATATLLDVGQGDATLLRLPGPFTVLVDTGGTQTGGDDVARLALLPCLRQARVGRLDLLVITPPHPDHYMAASHLLATIPVGEVWLPAGEEPEAEEAPGFAHLLAELQRRRIPVRRVDRDTPARSAGAARLAVLHPPPGGGGLAGNDRSIVLSLRLGESSLLLPGDLEHAGEELLLAWAAPGDLRHEVLKVAHHGSLTASGEAFLDAVGPRAAFFPLGHRNRYGFPHRPVWEAFARRSVGRYRADVHGALTYHLRPTGGELESFRPLPPE